MEKEYFYELLRQSVQDADMHPDELPGLDLYMDQIITLMEGKLASNKRYESDKLLTKTMINNYSKEGLIKPIKGKKYSKEHITQMLLIYSLKGTLSIQEIKSFLYWAEECGEKMTPQAVTDGYEKFLEGKAYQRELLPEQVQCMLEETGCDVTSKEGVFQAVLALSAMSQYLKVMVEKLLDSEILPAKEEAVLPCE
ncbi:MAG: DUF1836 domain-containing protein [Oscillospiraceae bacterium]|nr:DUF1836 domain-containing protein [Oscillospiraceae bacterium]